jgi:hypothetical protein
VYIMQQIPQIVWMLWLDFSTLKSTPAAAAAAAAKPDMTNFTGDSKIKQFVQHAQTLHIDTDWKINIINNNATLFYLLNDRVHRLKSKLDAVWITQLLLEKNVGAAHKSDCIRYFLLKYYGGVWLDCSTLLVTPFTWLATTNCNFVVPYVAADQVVQWVMRPAMDVSDKYSSTEQDIWVQDYFFKQITWGKMAMKNPFVPENYFIASCPNHTIINSTLKKLETFWKITPANATKQTINRQIRQHIMDMMYGKDKMFTHAFICADQVANCDRFTDPMYLEMIWSDGYLFNYIQMYSAICEWMGESTSTTQIQMQTTKNTQGKLRKDKCYNKKFYSTRCITADSKLRDFDSCSEVKITSGNKSIYMISASLLRYFKWGETLAARLEMKESMILKMLDFPDLQQKLTRNRQYFIKFGSRTRNSPIIHRLLEKLSEKQSPT